MLEKEIITQKNELFVAKERVTQLEQGGGVAHGARGNGGIGGYGIDFGNGKNVRCCSIVACRTLTASFLL